jgi:hypothetical protein
MPERKPVDGGFGLEQAKTRDRVSVETAAKFRFFFTGLVFAILSFAIQFPLKTSDQSLKIVEATSWAFIAITALLALLDIGGFSASSDSSSRLTPHARGFMWFAFLAGVVLLLTAKTWASLSGGS